MEVYKIKQLAFELMGNKYSPYSNEKGEKYYHGERVASLVIKLRKHIYPDDSSHDDILLVSAWFHDIMNGVENHNIEGANMTREVLSPYCAKGELDQICDIISVHDKRDFKRNYSKFVRLHQDADYLDHFGIFDVWRSFIHAIPHDQTILDIIEWMTKVRPTKNEKYRSELYFEISRKIFDEKMDFLNEFINRFKVECTGGIWDEEKLLSKF